MAGRGFARPWMSVTGFGFDAVTWTALKHPQVTGTSVVWEALRCPDYKTACCPESVPDQNKPASKLHLKGWRLGGIDEDGWFFFFLVVFKKRI